MPYNNKKTLELSNGGETTDRDQYERQTADGNQYVGAGGEEVRSENIFQRLMFPHGVHANAQRADAAYLIIIMSALEKSLKAANRTKATKFKISSR